MTTIILNHKVSDYKSWRKHYDADMPRRKGAGLKEIHVGTKAKEPNNVYIVFQTSNPSAFEKMAKDPALKEVMKKAGVLGEPEITILN